VSDIFSQSASDLYVVEFERHPGDLGVYVIVRANSKMMAKLEAFRLFPEHKHASSGTFVHLLDYAEIDWHTGQCFVVLRKKQIPVSDFTLDEPPLRRRRNAIRKEVK
jgi:hypothetical protein